MFSLDHSTLLSVSCSQLSHRPHGRRKIPAFSGYFDSIPTHLLGDFLPHSLNARFRNTEGFVLAKLELKGVLSTRQPHKGNFHCRQKLSFLWLWKSSSEVIHRQITYCYNIFHWCIPWCEIKRECLLPAGKILRVKYHKKGKKKRDSHDQILLINAHSQNTILITISGWKFPEC